MNFYFRFLANKANIGNNNNTNSKQIQHQKCIHQINLNNLDMPNENSSMLHNNHTTTQFQTNFDEDGEPRATYSYIKSYLVSMLQPSDNKLAMKLFGSKKGVLKEKARQQEVSHWVVHPCSNFRYVKL